MEDWANSRIREDRDTIMVLPTRPARGLASKGSTPIHRQMRLPWFCPGYIRWKLSAIHDGRGVVERDSTLINESLSLATSVYLRGQCPNEPFTDIHHYWRCDNHATAF